MNGPRTAGYAPPLDMKQAGTYYPKSTPCPVTHPDSQRKVLELEFRVIDELQMIHAVPGNMRRHNSILFRCHGFFILSILTDSGSIRPRPEIRMLWIACGVLPGRLRI